MKMKIVFAALSSAIVAMVVTGLASYVYHGKVFAEILLLQKTLELHQSEEKSFEAYENEQPEIGVWALENHLEFIQELDDIDYPKEKELQLNSMLTHARLGRLWSKLGDTEKESREVQESLRIAEAIGPMFRNVRSKEALWEIVDKFDASMNAND